MLTNQTWKVALGKRVREEKITVWYYIQDCCRRTASAGDKRNNSFADMAGRNVRDVKFIYDGVAAEKLTVQKYGRANIPQYNPPRSVNFKK